MTGHPLQPAAVSLTAPIQYLKGVGPSRAKLFARLEVHTVSDLLFFFPRDWQDLTTEATIDQLEENQPATVRGKIYDIDRRSGWGSSTQGVLIEQDGMYLRGVWFNQPWVLDKVALGQEVLLSGKPRLRGGRWEMAHPRLTLLDADEETSAGLLPVYPLTEGLKQQDLRRAVAGVLKTHAPLLEEALPEPLRQHHDLLPIAEALPQMHFPASPSMLERARRRFVFQELFVLQLALALRRRQRVEAAQASELPATAKIDARIRRLLPFELTADQNQAIGEIAADMSESQPMNRLLQGDVGSGKTLVAAYAMMLAVAHGCQAALMAPTEVLARQHAATLDRLLAKSRVRRGLLTGAVTGKQREATLAKIAAGEIDLVIGTQAIVQSDVQFARLGLVVIDEQHKFGVRQRAALKQAGVQPHYLVMTATPIPRSVTMTIFGDLEISTLRQAPPGRQPVKTYLVDETQRPRWWEFVRKKLRHGHQAYVVTPLVEASDGLEAENVEQVFEELANGELADFRLDLIHGRMTPTEKESAMHRFREGQTQVLVSTSVLEVGIDVPQATVMTVLSAERFGLAQLHQLRGRISRGAHPGFCGVFAQPQTEDSQRRLAAFVETSDGFKLAEIDFELRGPGDLLGTRQHGLPPLRVADLARDHEVLGEAQQAARGLIERDGDLSLAEHARLRRLVLARYGKVLELGDVG